MLEEIFDAKNQIQVEKREHSIRVPRYSGRYLIFLQKKKRITLLYKVCGYIPFFLSNKSLDVCSCSSDNSYFYVGLTRI